ncbi:MAG: hypothetical protein E6J91_37810 [Deltaproteobacteria bacterium]|nr:MAG: hypothetical protein E6J91_37810 [Deltaproteobacteria bacterium]
MARTRVYVTVDVECAEERNVGGRSLPALDYDARVWGRFRNQRDDLGIGLIMRELEAQGLRATFFTEVLGSQTFGIDGLRRIIGELCERGHDVQLHAHPIQRCARYRSLGHAPVDDDIGAYTLDEQTALLGEAIAILVSCGVPRDEVRAFRAGNYGASNTTWAAMAAVGLRFSSSYNPCYFDRNCRMRFADSRPGLFRAEHGIFELPISNFVERGGRHRHLQITAVSLAEMARYLEEARRIGIGEVTIVTHSFEFAHVDPRDPQRGRVNRINLHRLRGLCRFLRERDAEFEVETIGALAARLHAGDAAPSTTATEMPRGRRRDRARRLIEQGLKRMEAKLT